MTSIHFLNVGQGDCIIVEHDSGRVSMIDICGGNQAARPRPTPAAGPEARALGAAGNYNMADYPTNPIEYLRRIGIGSVFRFISTHPEMDHMDGLDELFRAVPIANFWHTGVNREAPEFSGRQPYGRQDWSRYCALRNGQVTGTTVLRRESEQYFKYANQNDDGAAGGDRLFILAPTQQLVAEASLTGEINDSSFVLLLQTSAGNMIFPGDGHDATWRHVLEKYRQHVSNCALLIAPHHGRDSDRGYDFLDVLCPRLTLFGVAPAEHMGYGAWSQRGLAKITNNQAGCVRVDVDGSRLNVWIENERFAQANGFDPTRRERRAGFVWFGTY